MVGIIIATHGDFANGILQSAQMIFGEQSDVKACTLMPNEGPEDIKGKMLEAIESFSNKEEVLFLTDLWSGTPFNQASLLLEGKEDKWAILSGLNLPMLIEVFGARLSADTAHEVASSVLGVSREEIKVKPESLDETKKTTCTNSKVTSAIPEGTVLGDGKIKYVLARVDTRLLHGQVATAWTKATNPSRIITVSDNVSKDELRKSMIVQAAPPGVKSNVIPISKLVQIDKDTRFGDTKALILFETIQDALSAIEQGVDIKEINLGSIAHSIGKVVLTTSVAMDKKDVETFEKLLSLGVKVDVRKVPSDTPADINQILNKARKELADK